jgi:hypothetical protein
VARLAGERTKAETCVHFLKQYGDKGAVGQGELTYGDAKGDVDAVIAGLIVALAKDDPPDSLGQSTKFYAPRGGNHRFRSPRHPSRLGLFANGRPKPRYGARLLSEKTFS